MGEAQHPGRPEKVASSCAVVLRRPPEPPLLPSRGKDPQDQHLSPVSNGAAMAPSTSASFSTYSVYWEAVGKPRDVEGKAVPARQGLW